MPLPPALLQRLAKRGLVDNKTARDKPAQPSEEIIAENYDSDESGDELASRSGNRRRNNDDEPIEPYPYDYEPAKKPAENFWKERMKRRMMDASLTSGYRACPNKYNIYHKCTLFCMNTYGDGVLEPNTEYIQRQARLLRRYPLPRDWKPVWDVGCGVHYYWNCKTDMVAWLPPGHPKASVGRAAAVLRRELDALVPDLEDPTADEPNMTIQIEGMNIELPIPYAAIEKPPAVDPVPPLRPPMPRKPKARDLDKAIRSQRRKRGGAGALDPMDPASYSDIPRGKWSAGLERTEDKPTATAEAIKASDNAVPPDDD